MQTENNQNRQYYEEQLFKKMWNHFITNAPQKRMNLAKSGDVFYLETINYQTHSNRITETKYRPIILVSGSDIIAKRLYKYFFDKPNRDDLYGIPLTTSSDPNKPANKNDLKLENNLKITFKDNKSYKVPQGKASYIRGMKIFKFSKEEQDRINELQNHPLVYQKFLTSLSKDQLYNILIATKKHLKQTVKTIGETNPYVKKAKRIALHPNPTIISIETKNPDNPRKDLPPEAINEPNSPKKSKDTDTGLTF